MTDNSYILFNKTLDECRRLGARGGRVQARNRRVRQLDQPPQLPMAPPQEASLETAAEAIAALDAQFPWLRGVERRKCPRGAKGAFTGFAANSQPQNFLPSLNASQA